MHLSINKTRIWGTIIYRIFLYNHQSIFCNENIAFFLKKHINISIQEYRDILKSCNVIIDTYAVRNEYYFKNEKDAQKAIEMLEEKYLVAIKLIGE